MTVRSSHRLSLIAILATCALLAAACGLSRDPAGGTAATVTFEDGSTQELSSDELNEYYDTIIDDTEFVAAAYGAAGAPPGLRSSILTDMIVGTVFDKLLVETGTTVSDANAEEGTASIENAVAALFPLDDDPTATAQARFETLPYLPFLADLQSKQFAIADGLVENSEGGEVVSVPCTSHIILETEEEANNVIALLDAGGDFAELAMEFSTGPSGPSGGVLGCSDPARFVPEFAAAIADEPTGTIIGPVQTEFGFHIITVTDFEEQVVGAPDPQTLVSSELLSAISKITVDVDPSIGEWDGSTGQVIPAG